MVDGKEGYGKSTDSGLRVDKGEVGLGYTVVNPEVQPRILRGTALPSFLLPDRGRVQDRVSEDDGTQKPGRGTDGVGRKVLCDAGQGRAPLVGGRERVPDPPSSRPKTLSLP